MFAKPENFAKAGVESAVFFAGTALDFAESLAALNLNIFRILGEASLSNAAAMLAAKDVQTLMSLQTGFIQLAIERSVDYSRSVYELGSEAKEEVSKAVEIQIADTQEKVSGLVQKALDNAPAGSEAAVAAVRSAIATGKDAYNGINTVTRQVAEIAQANIIAATAAAAKARKAA